MCDPMTALAVTQAAMSTYQQQQAADAQNKYEKIAYRQRRETAIDTMFQLREREIQERAKAAQDIASVTSQARSAAAAAKLTALETGTGGQSVTALLEDFQRGELANVGIVQSNLEATTRQLHAEQRAAGKIQGRRKVQGPLDSPLGILAGGLNIASAGLNAQNQQPQV